jgi:hypothetical protein
VFVGRWGGGAGARVGWRGGGRLGQLLVGLTGAPASVQEVLPKHHTPTHTSNCAWGFVSISFSICLWWERGLGRVIQWRGVPVVHRHRHLRGAAGCGGCATLCAPAEA